MTNQVTARPSGPAAHAFQQPQAQQQQQPNDGGGDGGQLAAALGTKWAHAVNVRLVLERQGDRRFIKVLCVLVAGCGLFLLSGAAT